MHLILALVLQPFNVIRLSCYYYSIIGVRKGQARFLSNLSMITMITVITIITMTVMMMMMMMMMMMVVVFYQCLLDW